jgi:hypothetical protein
MKRFVLGILLLLITAGSPLAQAQGKNVYSYAIPCSALWLAVRDTVRNSGHYAIVLIDNNEMVASFAIGVGQGLRIESAVLNPKGETCEMQVQPLYQPGLSNDDGDFKKRVEAAMAQLKSIQTAPPAKTETPNR